MNVVYACFTGKASLVLNQKGLKAITIHKLIYDAFKNRYTGRFYFRLKPKLDMDVDVIIVDEVSMVSQELLRDLLSFGIPLICLGDPGQLPAVGGNRNTLLDNPDVFLDEIHRQAKENSIIRLSMDIRNGNPLDISQDDPYIKIIKRDELSTGMMTWADQIICGKNATRTELNHIMRNVLGFAQQLPQNGDKLICLRNYWECLNSDDFPLINGTIGIASGVSADYEEGNRVGILPVRCVLDFTPDYNDNSFDRLTTDSNIFKGNAPFATSNPRSKMVFYEFDYGYAISCHKSQGSSFNNVLLFEEFLKGGVEDHKKWLYTGVTRAKEKLVLVRP